MLQSKRNTTKIDSSYIFLYISSHFFTGSVEVSSSKLVNASLILNDIILWLKIANVDQSTLTQMKLSLLACAALKTYGSNCM